MDSQLPSGTVTFLFTDIEGSTPLWEQMPDDMRAAVAQHNAILRGAIEAHGGQVFQIIGDAFAAAFPLADQGLCAAVQAQQALAAAQWGPTGQIRVRMGLHTGPAEPSAESEIPYKIGHTLNRASRVMSAGHGGQILLSLEAADLARRVLPDGVTLQDMGEHSLKGMRITEHLYQAFVPGLPVDYPPIKSLSAVPNNLPVQLTSFIGRKTEIAETLNLLSTARMVTLTGPGGTGKSRLSQEVAAEILPTFTDGVWLVELAPLTEGSQVLQAVSGVLNLQPLPGLTLLEVVTGILRRKKTLLILDNCEHLVEACAKLADHLLRACPDLKILASSREGLRIAGEVTYHLPSLSLPETDCDPDGLLRSEAARLFVERASEANPRFALTEGNTAAVAQICSRLDGIPLAIELAAARSRLFPPEQITARLDDRFRLLTGGSRTALPRQQTLQALIDWSYDLLSEPEKALLRGLSVFSGGWTFEAAEAAFPDLDVLDLLDELVHKSLVVVDDDPGQARYHFLETIRQYARDRLFEAGETAAQRDRHFDYYLNLSESAEPELRGVNAFNWIDRLALDRENLFAAIEWGLGSRPVDTLLLMDNLFFFWIFRIENRYQIIDWLQGLIDKVQIAQQSAGEALTGRRLHAVARGQTVISYMLIGVGNVADTIEAFTKAIALERELGDKTYISFVLGARASAAMMAGDIATATVYVEEGLALARQIENRHMLLAFLPTRMAVEQRQGNLEKAQVYRQEIDQILSQSAHPLFATTFIGLGIEARSQGQFEEAEVYFQQGLNIVHRLKNNGMIQVFESELAHIARQRGHLAQAKAAYHPIILTWRDFGQAAAVANMLENYAFIARAEEQLVRAASLLGAAQKLRSESNAVMRDYEQKEYDRELEALKAQCPAPDFTEAWNRGSALSLDEAVQFAISTTTT